MPNAEVDTLLTKGLLLILISTIITLRNIKPDDGDADVECPDLETVNPMPLHMTGLATSRTTIYHMNHTPELVMDVVRKFVLKARFAPEQYSGEA